MSPNSCSQSARSRLRRTAGELLASRLLAASTLFRPIVVVALLGNAAVFAVRTYPARRAAAQAQAAYDAAESDLHAARQQFRSLQVLGGDALRAADDLRVFLNQRLDSTSSLPETLAYLRASATAAGMSLENIDYSAEPVEQLDALSLGMSVRGAGSYAAVRRWIAALRQGPGLMFVDSVEIGGAGGLVLSVELTAVAMLRAEGASTP